MSSRAPGCRTTTITLKGLNFVIFNGLTISSISMLTHIPSETEPLDQDSQGAASTIGKEKGLSQDIQSVIQGIHCD